VTQQTLQAMMGEPVGGTTSVVFPAGAATTRKLLAAHSGLRLIPDDSDVQLAVGLNRALGACTSMASSSCATTRNFRAARSNGS